MSPADGQSAKDKETVPTSNPTTAEIDGATETENQRGENQLNGSSESGPAEVPLLVESTIEEGEEEKADVDEPVPQVRLRPKKGPTPLSKPSSESLGIDSKLPAVGKKSAKNTMKIEELQENGEESPVPNESAEPNGTQTPHEPNGIHESNGNSTNGTSENGADEAEDEVPDMVQGVDSHTAALLRRTMGVLYEASPDHEDNTEEIRRLDSQLDHLNEYMDRVEQRLKEHNEKLMETLRQQKEDREKRRQSFHERLEASQKEDDDFQRQLSQILNRVDISRNSLHISEPTAAGEEEMLEKSE